MLKMNDDERKILLANDALTTNLVGDEVLRGLTVTESSFVLAVAGTADHNVGAAESDMYRSLRERHAQSVQLFGINVETYLRTVCGYAGTA